MKLIVLKFKLTIFSAFVCLGHNALSQKLNGANGHPLTQGAYSNISEQFELLSSLNANIYRIDIPISKEGQPINISAFKKLVITNEKYPEIKILPMLSPQVNLLDGNLESQFSRGYKIGWLFFSNYEDELKEFSEYFEIGNEIDLRAIKGAQFSGQSINHYDLDIIKKYAAFYQGFIKALKIFHPNNKIVVNFAFTHWGFLNYLEQLNFPYDVIGLHWYSNMGNLYSYGKEGVNIIDTLSSKFNKKILVDEFNVYQGSLEYIPNSNQENWLHENLVEILSNSNSLGVIFYELLDQPDFAKNPYSDYYNPGESAYGLYENKTSEKGYILKELYENILLK